MALSDEIAAEFDRLGVDGWQRTIALELADSVEQRGTVSAAVALRTHMLELARENAPETGPDDFIAGLKVKLGPLGLAGSKRPKVVPESRPEMPESRPESRPKRKPRATGPLCIECGRPMPKQTQGRPRVRHHECRRTRTTTGRAAAESRNSNG